MGRRTVQLMLLGLMAAGLLGAVRQRRESAAVRAGTLRRLGPTGEADDAASPVHARLSRWHPDPVGPGLPRAIAVAWAAPLSIVGALGAVLGGARPRWDGAAGCFVATSVGGPAGRFLAAQGAAAATLGHVVVSRQDAMSPALLRHEVEHVRQTERLGPLYAVAYPLAQAAWGYRRNPFEVAARRAAAGLSEPAAPA